ncbi:MAG: hypothetical protein IKH53_06655 [Muribaculaceae bacterium]|nr:hypothetical protein [Muribaculaceae bacterium]
MKHLFKTLSFAVVALFVLGACSGSNGLLGKTPDIIADGIKQQEELNEQAKQADKKDAETFEKMMKKAMDIIFDLNKKLTKEASRIQGKSIPSTGGESCYDFIKIQDVVIDTVKFDATKIRANVVLRFVPSADFDQSSVPYGSKVYFAFMGKDDNVIKLDSLYTSRLTTSINLSKISSVTPEQWKELKEIRFLTAQDARKR